MIAELAAAVDHVFRGAMRTCGERGGPSLRDRYGPGSGGLLVEFRTSLATRVVSRAGLAAVARYRDVEDLWRGAGRQAEAGFLEVLDDGLRATARGRAYIADLYATQAAVLESLWPDVPRLAGLTALRSG